MYGIEGANFAAGIELSPAVEQAVEVMVERLAQKIQAAVDNFT